MARSKRTFVIDPGETFRDLETTAKTVKSMGIIYNQNCCMLFPGIVSACAYKQRTYFWTVSLMFQRQAASTLCQR